MRYFRPGWISRPPLQVIWSPIDKTSNVALTNSSLSAEFTSNANGGTRATVPRLTGKWYCEFTPNTISKPGTGIGLAAGNLDFTVAQFSSDAPKGFIVFWSGSTSKNGAFVFSLASLSAGAVVRCAYDADNHEAWLAVTTGFWNASGAADPETNVGGQLTSGFDSNGLFPVFVGADNAQKMTGNFGASAFTYAVPTGFSAWNTS